MERSPGNLNSHRQAIAVTLNFSSQLLSPLCIGCRQRFPTRSFAYLAAQDEHKYTVYLLVSRALHLRARQSPRF
jgi:hypothetical protein